MTNGRRDLIAEGEQDYQEWRASLTDTPEKQATYGAIAAKSDLWLQLVEARQAAGLSQRDLAKRLGVSQAQVARLEKRGYDAHSVNSLRRYVEALGEGFSLGITVHQPDEARSRRDANDRPIRPKSDALRGP
jgi:ribosome-binding protein aMBF1 (putative translation factor)